MECVRLHCLEINVIWPLIENCLTGQFSESLSHSVHCHCGIYSKLYNNKVNVRSLIGQSAIA